MSCLLHNSAYHSIWLNSLHLVLSLRRSGIGPATSSNPSPHHTMFSTPRSYSTPHLANKIPVAILGATGMVGRRFAELLADHPYFSVVQVAASPSSQGKNYNELVTARWCTIPRWLFHLTLDNIWDISRDHVRLVFSAFEGTKDEILSTESELAKKWFVVVSNNSAHRWTPDVPMMLPEVNPEHLSLLTTQSSYLEKRWGIVVKPNCSIQSFVPILKAWEVFGIKRVHVVTEQSISGAGKTYREWPDMVDNVIPYIWGEEAKSENEPLKVLGKIRDWVLSKLDLPISAICTRVASSDGHMANVFVEFHESPSEEHLKKAITEYVNPIGMHHLPSSPDQFMIYTDDPDRPQTRLDRDNGDGMSITVWRLQNKWHNTYSFSALSHNTLRWAAGWAVLTAEVLHAKWYLRD